MKSENDKIADTKNDVNTGNIAPETSSTELSDEKLDNVSGGYNVHKTKRELVYPKEREGPGRAVTKEKCSVCGKYYICSIMDDFIAIITQTTPDEKLCPECKAAKQ